MKKGKQIEKVEISNGYVSAFYANGKEVKLSRTERNLFQKIPQKGRKFYTNSKEYVDNIVKAFGGNPEILSSEFTVYKDGDIAFTYTKNY